MMRRRSPPAFAAVLLALVAITLNRAAVDAYPIIAEIDDDDETVSSLCRQRQRVGLSEGSGVEHFYVGTGIVST